LFRSEILDLNGDFDDLFQPPQQQTTNNSTNNNQNQQSNELKLPKLESLKEIAIQLTTHETKEIPFRQLQAADLNAAFTLEISNVKFLLKCFHFIILFYFIILLNKQT